MVVPVRLTRGYHALVSLADYEMVATIRWRASIQPDGHIYAVAHVPGSGKRGKRMQMHRFILGAKAGQIVDHWNGMGLCNWRENLRLCTNRQNIQNQRPHVDKRTSKYKGVSFIAQKKAFRAQIVVDGKKINLGNFKDELSAARAYDAASLRFHREFSRNNGLITAVKGAA